MRGTPLPEPAHPDLEARLNDVLDSLNSDKKKPFTRD
jgi:hypothetical protein